MIAGDVPPDGNSRLLKIAEGQPDPYESLVGRVDGYPDHFLRAIDKALRVLPRDRFQSADEWLAATEGKISSEGAEAAIASLMTWLDTNPEDMKDKPVRLSLEESAEGATAKRGPVVKTAVEEDKPTTQSESLRMIEARVARKKKKDVLPPISVEPDPEPEVANIPDRRPAEFRIRRAAAWVIAMSFGLGTVIWPF